MRHLPATAGRRLPLPALSEGTRGFLWALGFAALIAAGARLAVPLPPSPVPLTLQVPFVLLAGAVLGPRRAAWSLAMYLGAGLAGLPVFAAGGGPAYLAGPTGGYLAGFLPAAMLAGWLARRAGGSFWRLALALTPGLVVIHVLGAAHLALLGADPDTALRFGLLPFLATDALQIAGAASLAALWRARSRRA